MTRGNGDPLGEAAFLSAKALADARERLLRIREACDHGIRSIEEGKATARLTYANDPTLSEEMRGVDHDFAACSTLRAAFGDALDAPTVEALAARLGRHFRGGAR